MAGLAGSKEARASTGALCLGRLGAPPFIVFVFAWCAARLAKPALPTAAAHPEGEPVLLVCLSCLLSSSPALRAVHVLRRVGGPGALVGTSAVLHREIASLGLLLSSPALLGVCSQAGWQARPAQASQASPNPVQSVQPLCRPCVSARCFLSCSGAGTPLSLLFRQTTTARTGMVALRHVSQWPARWLPDVVLGLSSCQVVAHIPGPLAIGFSQLP